MYKIGRVRIYFTLLVAIILQLTAAPYLAIGGVKPDLITMFIVIFGLFYGPRTGFEAGLLGGFLKDVFALDFFWMNTFLGAATGLFAGAISSQFSKESKFVCIFLVAALTGISMVLHYAVAALISPYHALGFFEYLAGTILPGLTATGIISMVAFLYFGDMFIMKNGADLL